MEPKGKNKTNEAKRNSLASEKFLEVQKPFFKKVSGRRRHSNPSDEEPPPVLKSWRNFYWLVLGNLLFWIALFTLFTWMFK